MRKRMLHFLWMAGCALVLLSVSPLANSADEEANKKDDEYFELMRTFVETFEQIERSYVKDVDRQQLMEAAIKGMVGELDQYSSFISRDDMERFTRDIEQQFGGIGIMVEGPPEKEHLKVITPFPGTPAYKAGLRAGDQITKIESKSTEGMTVEDAVKLMKGNPGEAVNITIRHAGSNKEQDVHIVREVIQMATVLGDTYKKGGKWNFMLDEEKKIGYIRLTHFSRRTTDELKEALEDLQSAGMKALIFDLRSNPGGLLSQATEVADLFIESGKIVSTKGRNTEERTWTASRRGTYTGFPMVVLVNRFSASASEIVSACLQDHDRALIVGERSWGKGSVQNVIDLAGGNSALKLTTASYYRPSGENIHRFPGAKEEDVWGVMPDEGYEVKYSFPQLRAYQEYRRERDILREGAPPESEFKDTQLEKGLSYLLDVLAGKRPANEKEEKPAVEAAKPSLSLRGVPGPRRSGVSGRLPAAPLRSTAA